jgi:hypothetical protein
VSTQSSDRTAEAETERRGEFRVYRVVESVPHINFQQISEPRLYTVYKSGYETGVPASDESATQQTGETAVTTGETAVTQEAVDDLVTGDRVEATLVGDPDADDEAWHLAELDRVGGVEMAFATDIDPPAIAGDTWESGTERAICRTLRADGEPAGACCVQPRDPLPNGAFVPNVVTGLLPLEAQFASVPGVEESAAEALFLDPDSPDATRYDAPYGVLLLFTSDGRSLADRFRDAYDLPRGTDTRPDFDPYGI